MVLKNLTYISIVLVVFWLGGCATYQAPKGLMASCEDYISHLRQTEDKDYVSHPDFTDNPDYMDDWNHDIDLHNNTKPIIVRYSESGELVSRCDYNRALRAVAKNEDKLVVVYIHGWNNDSGSTHSVTYNDPYAPLIQANGGDLENFSFFLNRLRKEEMQGENRAVVGIFISWKGDTPAKYINYFSRKRGADILGRSAHVPRMLGAIENIKLKREADGQDMTLIYMGHSFGASILYSSIAPQLMAETQAQYCWREGRQFQNTYGIIDSGADLVFLANPVISASYYKAFDEFRYTRCGFDPAQMPVMISIQSVADGPTRLWYRLSQTVERVFFLNADMRLRRTYGHFEDHHTHTMTRLQNNQSCSNQEISTDGQFCAANIKMEYAPSQNYSGTNQMSPSPFLVIRVEQDVLRGHGWLSEHNHVSDSDELSGTIFDWIVAYMSVFEKQKIAAIN